MLLFADYLVQSPSLPLCHRADQEVALSTRELFHLPICRQAITNSAKFFSRARIRNRANTEKLIVGKTSRRNWQGASPV